MVVKMWYYLWGLLKILLKQTMAAYCSSQLAYSRIVGCLKAVVQEGKIPSHLSLYETNFYNLAKKKCLAIVSNCLCKKIFCCSFSLVSLRATLNFKGDLVCAP